MSVNQIIIFLYNEYEMRIITETILYFKVINNNSVNEKVSFVTFELRSRAVWMWYTEK